MNKYLSVLIVVLVFSFSTLSTAEESICKRAESAIRGENYKLGVVLLTQCLKDDSLTDGYRSFYLKLRAWGHSNSGRSLQAVDDQKASLKIRDERKYTDYINLGVYLRNSNLDQESLVAFRTAEEIEGQVDKPTMMTQYNLGWTLYKLGQYEESVEKISLGLEFQPQFPFAYLRRGMAYHELSETKKARSDMALFVSYYLIAPMQIPSENVREIERMAKTYPVLNSVLSSQLN